MFYISPMIGKVGVIFSVVHSYMYSWIISVIVSIVMLMFRIFFFSSYSPVDLLIRYKNFEAINTAGVTLLNSKFFSVGNFRVNRSSAVSLGSRIIPKKSILLWSLFLSGMCWSLNKEYTLFMLILFGSLSLIVLVNFVTAASPNAQMNISIIFTSTSSLYWDRISLSFVIIFRSMSRVILTYWMNFSTRVSLLVWSSSQRSVR